MEKTCLSRRDFLRLSAGAAAGTLLTACTSKVVNETVEVEKVEPITGGNTMNQLDVIARMQVRKGKLDGFKKQAAEIIRQVKEKDTGTLRYDWFLSSDETECEILEAYVSSDAWIEHRKNIGEALDVLFSEYADNHNVLVFGEPSPELFEMGNRLMAGRIQWFSFLNGPKS